MSTQIRIKAWRYHKGGELPAVLQQDDIEVTQPKKGEILIDVTHAALNPIDYKVSANMSFTTKKPRTAGADYAGKVAALGPGTESKGLKVGDSVYGFLPLDVGNKNGRGSVAQKLLVDQFYVEPVPSFYTMEQAAGLTLVGLTALELADSTKAGDRVLVSGGSTSVGLLLLPMLKAKGVKEIVATGSGNKISIIKERGADEVIDYRATDASKELVARFSKNQFDVILDTVGEPPIYYKSDSYLKKGGIYHNIGATLLTPGQGGMLALVKFSLKAMLLPTFLGGVRAKFHTAGLDNKKMGNFAALAKELDLKPLTDKAFPFNETPQAYRHLMDGRALGKVVIQI